MAAISLIFCFHANWPLWPRLRLNILLNFTLESEAITTNLRGNKRMLKWRPFGIKCIDLMSKKANAGTGAMRRIRRIYSRRYIRA